jgi:hypothetical protein
MADVDVLQQCFILQSSSEYQMVCSLSSRAATDSKISLIRMIFAKPFPFLTYMYLYRHVSFFQMHDKPHYVIRRDLEKSAAWKMGFMLSAAP